RVVRAGTGASTPLTITLDFSSMTSLTSTATDVKMNAQDGQKIGTLVDFSVGTNGIITGTFNDGLTAQLGQMAIATVDNPPGLVDKGGNVYVAGANSGSPAICAPLQGK